MRQPPLLLMVAAALASTASSRFIERDDSWIPRLTRADLYGGYELVSRIPLTSLLKFNFYRDVSVLYYAMPDDVAEARFFFKAHEDKLSALGGKCEPQDIDVHLKHGGIPVVNPQNVSFPEDFIDERLRGAEIRSAKMKSDGENASIVIANPAPGDWFGLAFVSWTDPKTDKIEQQGIATVCDTVFYTDLRILKAPVTIVSPNPHLEIFLKNTTDDVVDLYKFFNDRETSEYALNLSLISHCDSCARAHISVQARSLPGDDDDGHVISCYVDLRLNTHNLTLDFDSYPTEWHYLKVRYGGEATEDDASIEECAFRNNGSAPAAEHVVSLVRDTKSEYFTFEYNLPPHPDFTPALFNVTSNNATSLRFNVFPVQDIGGTLSVGVSLKLDIKYYKGYRRKKSGSGETYYTEADRFVKLVVCLARNTRTKPLVEGECEFNGKRRPANIVVNNTDVSASSVVVHIPYPEVGAWYATFGLYCDGQTICPCSTVVENNVTHYLASNSKREEGAKETHRMGSAECKSGVIFSVSSAPCIEGKCGRNGVCNYYMSGGFIYSSCRCRSGYSGWDCSDAKYATPASEILTSVLFLTLSNLLFVPSVYYAVRRQYYTEASVYFFTMFFSTFYHACDVGDPNYSYCIVRLGVLQYCDFFCGLLSFWVTLVAMAALDARHASLLHMIGAIAIAFGTELNKQALLVFVVPVAVGACVVVAAWALRCRRTGKMFPARGYLVVYLPAGLALSAVGLVCFAFLQTNANYHVVHSVWHMVIALSILCLLPIRRVFFPKS